MNVVQDITDYLNQSDDPDLVWLIRPSDVGPDEEGTLFKDDMPPSPDRALSVTRYEGQAPRETFGNPFHGRRPRFQVMIRDTDGERAFAVADRIIKYLNLKGVTINGHYYERVKAVGEVTEVGPDKSDRQRVTVNFETIIHDTP